jgi:hypothetical protein
MAQQHNSWKYNPVTGVVLVVLIIGAVVGMFLFRRSGRTELGPTQKIVAICEETWEVFELEIPTGDPGPYLSPKTNRKTAWFAMRCQNCGIIYPMKEQPANKVPCPNCGLKVPTIVVLPPKPKDQQ